VIEPLHFAGRTHCPAPEELSRNTMLRGSKRWNLPSGTPGGPVTGDRQSSSTLNNGQAASLETILLFTLSPHLMPPGPFGARRQTVTTWIGGVPVGSAVPVVVQSMTNTDTADAAATTDQVIALARVGSQLVRVTVNTDDAAAAVPAIVGRVADAG